MYKFIAKKIAYGILVLIGVIVVVFLLFNVLPGDPARLTLGQRADVASIEAVNKELGLDKPLPIQFFMYVNDLLPISIHDDTPENEEKYGYTSLFNIGKEVIVFKAPYLRRSYQTRKNVTEIIAEALPGTAILALSAIIFASILGIFLGVMAAINKGSLIDHATLVFTALGTAVPSFFSSIIFSFLFGYVLSEYTGLEMTGSLYETDAIDGEYLALQNLILPMISLGIRPLAIIVQLTRSSMLDILSQDYIRTARAKGLPRKIVLFKHALRNALNPVFTAISGWFAGMLAGAFFVELIFNWKGLGLATVNALMSSDFPIVMGGVLVIATVFVVINVLVDITYGILDPRVSLK